VPHGLAVAWGLDVANFVAVRSGLLDRAIFERIHDLLARHFAFTVQAPYSAATLVAAMRRDKKAAGSMVTLILPHRIGGLRLVPRALDGDLEADVEAYVAGYDIFRKT
jgi:3-dehydroquinate synthase